MRIRTFLPMAALAVALIIPTTGCGTDSDGGGTTGTSASQAEKPKGEGEPIDVKAELLKQGFKETQIAAVAKDSAYWLMPFGAPFFMSQQPDQPTCMFMITRADFRTDPAKKAYVDYPIKSNSDVKVSTQFLNADGSMGDKKFSKGATTMAFKDVTPQALANNKDLPLSECGNTKLS